MKLKGNNISKFRNLLAENGIEMTLDQAAKAYVMAKDIISKSKKMSMHDIWSILEIETEGMSLEDKEEIADLYRAAKEL